MVQKIFVTGCARSGTSLLLLLMRSLEGVHVIHDQEWCPFRFHQLLNSNLQRFAPSRYVAIKRPQLQRGKEGYFSVQDLLNMQYKIVIIIRDCRDVLVSRHKLRPDEYWVKPERWVDAIHDTSRYGSHSEIFSLRYEDLAANPNKALKSIAVFFQAHLSESYKTFYADLNPEASMTIALNEPRPISTDRIGQWRLPEHRQRIIEIVRKYGSSLCPLLCKLGYEKDDNWTKEYMWEEA